LQPEIAGRYVMATRYVLAEYTNQAMAQAVYDKLEDGTFTGRIPSCKGVVAFGPHCENVKTNCVPPSKTGSWSVLNSGLLT
jgi:hypothetical protein